ncbi:YlzJ-like family protein [Aquibacillus kalidii]|uniref:YlzJ-like family protein n=1 Tax=Aquibacillus kalidii TaxID=2762597 RepID=UPI00164422ED|nr:YlzJ-like family protein [Aquibacillus kalidii]
MILYTPLSETDIYPVSSDSYTKFQTIEVNGKRLTVEDLQDGSYRIVQLLSTNPHDYLNANFTPGQII